MRRRLTRRIVSEAQRGANRADAARSTGPRTAAGQAVAARNAWRHGLRVPVLADATLAPDVAALADAIAGKGARPASRAAAARIAEAQIDLVRGARAALMAKPVDGGDVTRDLVRLDRYERRGFARRSRALKDFDRAAWDDLRSRKNTAPTATSDRIGFVRRGGENG